ncbi:hypothetical protein CBL_20910, partial [Carabus blaptoides fortunei]
NGTNQTKKPNQGVFSDGTQPLDNQESAGPSITIAYLGPFPCQAENCDRVFKTKTGRGVHHQHAHKNWYDSEQIARKPHKKRRWTSEELSMMAKEEALQIATTGKADIRGLAALTERTADAVKGQRKATSYRSLVTSFSVTNPPPEGKPPSPPPTLQTPPT